MEIILTQATTLLDALSDWTKTIDMPIFFNLWITLETDIYLVILFCIIVWLNPRKLAHTKIKTFIVTVNPLRMLCRGAFYSSSRLGALCRNNSFDSFSGTERTFRVRENKLYNAEIYTGIEPNNRQFNSSDLERGKVIRMAPIDITIQYMTGDNSSDY